MGTTGSLRVANGVHDLNTSGLMAFIATSPLKDTQQTISSENTFKNTSLARVEAKYVDS